MISSLGSSSWKEGSVPSEPTEPSPLKAPVRLLLALLVAVAVVGVGGGVLVGPPAGATPAILYVASSGSNSGDCASATTPCATVSYALSNAGAGATIYVSGTIVDNLLITRSVTIAQEPGGLPAVLNGGANTSVVTTEDVAHATFDRVTIENGSASQGGGILAFDSTVTLVDSTVTGNVAADPDQPGEGGGIYVVGGTLALVDSTVAGNVAQDEDGMPASGGGIYVDGGALTVVDSTLADNVAQAATDVGGYGGAIIEDNSTATIIDSTFADNSTQGIGLGDAVDFAGGTAVVAGDIFAGHQGDGFGECSGTPTDAGYDISDDSSCDLTGVGSINDATTLDSFLGPLADNGGPTDTVALLPGSTGHPDSAQAVIPATFVAPGQGVPACRQPDQRGVARAAPCDVGAYALTVAPTPAPSGGGTSSTTDTSSGSGYWLAAADGGVFAYGDAKFYGSMVGHHLRAPVVGIASMPDERGYWLAAADGGVFAYGDAKFYGSMAGRHLNSPIVGIAEASDGRGYWLVAADGGVFAFGSAPFMGSMGGHHLKTPVVGIRTGVNGGYWLVAADGGVFAFGGAPYEGSASRMRLRAPVVGLARTEDGRGYWLVASDGGVFAYGDATFEGSAVGRHLSAPVVGIKRMGDGAGYWLVGADGGVFAYGAPFEGSHGGSTLNASIVGLAD